MNKVSCVIPAYNEEDRIKNVLDVIYDNPLINEIIVIDDCSSDNTKEIIKKYKNITFLLHEKNEGKSKSVYDGIKLSKGDFILLLDADLIGLTKDNILKLIEPVVDDKADISISLRSNTPLFWKIIGIDYISGERVIPRKYLMEQIEEIPLLPGFGLEVFINSIIIKNSLKIKIVNWNNVESPYKYKKYGYIKGIKSDIKMILEIFKTVGVWGTMQQIFKMNNLKV